MQRFDGRDPALQQVRWRATAAPAGSVRPGETFEVDVPDSSSGQLTPTSTRADLQNLDLARVDAAVGPIEVVGARPGDSVVVRIEAIEPADWGWSGIFRDFGLLRGRFDDDLVVWRRREGAMVPASGFLRPVEIPMQPMVGWIGVAPATGELGMIPPQVHGGNLDNRLHGVGTELELPVQRAGAQLLVGDVHAAQGDGEVCGTGIEVPARLRLSVVLRRNRPLRGPRAIAHVAASPTGVCWVTEGVASDPRVAARIATEEMVERWTERGLRAEEAYLLLSIAGYLRVSEAVDEPNWVVSMVLEEALATRAAAVPPLPSR